MTPAQSNRVMSSPVLAPDLMLWLADIKVCSFRLPMQIRGDPLPRMLDEVKKMGLISCFCCLNPSNPICVFWHPQSGSLQSPAVTRHSNDPLLALPGPKQAPDGGFADANNSTAEWETVPIGITLKIIAGRDRDFITFLFSSLASWLTVLKLLLPIEILLFYYGNS